MAKKVDKRQLSFFTENKEARIERDKAILQAEAAAQRDWLARAWRVLIKVARTYDWFTSETIWEEGLEMPREPRALGSVLVRAVKAGIIQRTGKYIQSSRRSRHCAPITVWKSNLT